MAETALFFQYKNAGVSEARHELRSYEKDAFSFEGQVIKYAR